MKIKLENIDGNPYNTRRNYGDLEGLKNSLQRFGLMHPFLVRKGEGEKYQLAFGSRRYKALKEIGINEVDVEIREISNSDMAMLAICENVHRKDLNAVEMAQAYEKGISTSRVNPKEFSSMVGVSYATVLGYLAILKLPDRILKREEKFGKMRMIALGKAQCLSSNVRSMLENLLENKEISSKFIDQITLACERVYDSGLPDQRKIKVCGEIIFHDYSQITPDNYHDITTFAEVLMKDEFEEYQAGLRKTAKARATEKHLGKHVRNVNDIVHVNQKIDKISLDMRRTASQIGRAREKGYYANSTLRSKGKFRTAVSRLTSEIERILKDEEID